MGCATLSESAPMNFPSPGSARKGHLQRAVGFGVETIREAQVGSALAHQSLRWLSKQFLACAVYKPKLLVTVERENSDLDFSHNGPQKSGGFQSAKPLFA